MKQRTRCRVKRPAQQKRRLCKNWNKSRWQFQTTWIFIGTKVSAVKHDTTKNGSEIEHKVGWDFMRSNTSFYSPFRFVLTAGEVQVNGLVNTWAIWPRASRSGVVVCKKTSQNLVNMLCFLQWWSCFLFVFDSRQYFWFSRTFVWKNSVFRNKITTIGGQLWEFQASQDSEG